MLTSKIAGVFLEPRFEQTAVTEPERAVHARPGLLRESSGRLSNKEESCQPVVLACKEIPHLTGSSLWVSYHLSALHGTRESGMRHSALAGCLLIALGSPVVAAPGSAETIKVGVLSQSENNWPLF